MFTLAWIFPQLRAFRVVSHLFLFILASSMWPRNRVDHERWWNESYFLDAFLQREVGRSAVICDTKVSGLSKLNCLLQLTLGRTLVKKVFCLPVSMMLLKVGVGLITALPYSFPFIFEHSKFMSFYCFVCGWRWADWKVWLICDTPLGFELPRMRILSLCFKGTHRLTRCW